MDNKFRCKEFTLKQLKSNLTDFVDLFVCSASYESRCLSVPLSLDTSNIGKAVILQNEDVLGQGIEHKNRLMKCFGSKAESVIISKKSAIRTADKIINIVSNFSNKKNFRCNVDVTTMTHETLLILFRVLKGILMPCADITFLYNPAAEYDPGKPTEEKWLSRGLKEVRSILGFPGEIRPSQKNHLVVLVGFEVDRAAKLIENYEPTTLSLGLGDSSPIHSQHLMVNTHKFERLKRSYSNAMQFSFSPTNAFEVRDTILERCEAVPDQNIIVAPMNTKISTLGVALAALQKPKIQICYARAAVYNVENYSCPNDNCYVFRL